MNNETLLKRMLFLDDNRLQALHLDDRSKCDTVAHVLHINPEYLNLLRGSCLMYQNLVMQWNALEVLIRVEEQKPGTQVLVNTLIAMQNALTITRRAVIEGIDTVADEFRNLSE